MMTITFKPTESLEIVKEYQPTNWVKTIEPFVRQMCHASETEKVSFKAITTTLFNNETSEVKQHYILAAHKHIQNQLKAFKALHQELNQYKKQLVALDNATDYAHQDKTDLRLFYQQKIKSLSAQKKRMLIYDEVIGCLDLKEETNVLN